MVKIKRKAKIYFFVFHHTFVVTYHPWDNNTKSNEALFHFSLSKVFFISVASAKNDPALRIILCMLTQTATPFDFGSISG